MNLEKANFFTIIQFGTKELFIQKLDMERCSLSDIMDLKDETEVSLLEKSLANRKFDIAQMLIENGVQLNVVSKENCNELHYLFANIDSDESMAIAKQLVEAGVTLNLQDKKYKNTPFWYLCEKAIQKNSQEMNELIKVCMKKAPDLNAPNIAGNTVKSMLLERGSKALKEIVLEEK